MFKLFVLIAKKTFKFFELKEKQFHSDYAVNILGISIYMFSRPHNSIESLIGFIISKQCS